MMLAKRSRYRASDEAGLRHFHSGMLSRRVVLWSSLFAVSAMLTTAPVLAQRPQPLPSPAATAPPAGPVGVWFDDTGRGAVEIKPCGSNLCGVIYWLQEPISAKTGRPVLDAYNPDSAKRERSICGLQVIGGVKQQPDGGWDEGWIYDPKVGKSYDVMFALEKQDRLSVTGYKGVKFLSKTFVWTRAPANLPRCDATGAAMPANRLQPSALPAASGAAQKAQPPARATTTPLPSPTQR